MRDIEIYRGDYDSELNYFHGRQAIGREEVVLKTKKNTNLPTEPEILSALRDSYRVRLEIIRELIQENEALAAENSALRGKQEVEK